MSDNLERIDFFITKARIIAKKQYDLADDLIEDLIIGGITNVLSGRAPSTLMVLTAYDMNLEPSSKGIIDYIFADIQAGMKARKDKKNV